MPFAITVDHRTLEDGTVTLRERDSCGQVRIPVAEVVAVVTALVAGALWEDASARFPKQQPASEE